MSGATPEIVLPEPLAAAVERTAALVAELERHPDPTVAEGVSALLQAVDQLHRHALRRLVELLDPGQRERLSADPAVRLLFDLYDLDAAGERDRAAAVLASARPLLGALGEGIELVAAAGGVVRVRLGPASAGAEAQVRELLEATLRRGLPDLERLEIEPPAGPRSAPTPDRARPGRPRPEAARSTAGCADPASGLVAALRGAPDPPRAPEALGTPLAWAPVRFGLGPVPRTRWVPVAARAELAAAGVLVRAAGAERVLLAAVAGAVRAYRNACGDSPLPLDAARRAGGALICPWHGCRYDLATGQRLDRPDAPPLASVPVRAEGEQLLVRVRDRGGAP